MADEVLPDSRLADRKGRLVVNGEDYDPVFCINCGRSCGAVPARLITHVTALCDHGCAGKYGDLADTFKDPDAVFREHLGQELSKLGRQVTLVELEEMVEDTSTGSLAALARDWQRHVSKENP